MAEASAGQCIVTICTSTHTKAEVIERVIEVEKPSPALDLLRSIDVDNLTPRQALEQLYALKEQLNA